MAAAERYAYVELVGGADGTNTALLLCVGRCGADALRNRAACYAFRCGEGCARLLGANEVSLKGLKATFCCTPADALGVPELFMACREAGAPMPRVMGDEAAGTVAKAALRAACPWASVDVAEGYADDHIRVRRDGCAFVVDVCDRTLVVSSGAYDADADVVLHAPPEESDTQIIHKIVVDYAREGAKRGFAKANLLRNERAAFFAVKTTGGTPRAGVRRCYLAPRPRVETSGEDVEATPSHSDDGDEAAAPCQDEDPSPRLTFLGTGSAKPSSRRGESAILVEWAASAALLDCGAGTLRALAQLRDAGATLDALDAVWVSHAHWDHFGGLAALAHAAATRRGRSNADVAQALKRRRVEETRAPLHVLAPARVADFLRIALEVLGAPAGGYALHIIKDQASDVVRLQALTVMSVRVTHCRGAFACIVQHNEDWAVAYSGDGRPSDHFARKCAARDKLLLIHEATFADADVARALTTKHSTVSEALQVAEAANADACVLTHFSQRYDGVLHVNSALVAFDGLSVRAATVPVLYEASSKCEQAVVDSAARRREARKLQRWDLQATEQLPDVRGAAIVAQPVVDPLVDALRTFYGAHAPGKVKDAPQVAAVFRRDFAAMDDRLFRKYGARLNLPEVDSSDSSDDEAEAVLAAPGGFALLAAAGCGDLPVRPVL